MTKEEISILKQKLFLLKQEIKNLSKESLEIEKQIVEAEFNYNFSDFKRPDKYFYSEEEFLNTLIDSVCKFNTVTREEFFKSSSYGKLRHMFYHIILQNTTITKIELAHILKIDRTTIVGAIRSCEDHGYCYEKEYELIEYAVQGFLRFHSDNIKFIKK